MMWVNGELRFSNENLMDLWHFVSLALDMLDEMSETFGPKDVQKARELAEKAESAVNLSEIILRELTERLNHGSDAAHPQD